MEASMPAPKLCSIPDCGKKHYGLGWCNKHWQRWRNHGDPEAVLIAERGTPLRFLFEVAVPCTNEDCLVWPFGVDRQGRAVMRLGGRTVRVGREVCRLKHGEPPTPKHEAAHSCGKGHEGCVNGSHLEWKTHAGNLADRIIHGTSNRGEQHGMAKLTDTDTRAIMALKGKRLQREIAAMFGVSRETISGIHRGKRWAWLDGGAP
jgi:hypothetical protein